MEPVTLTSPAVEATTTRLSPGGIDVLSPFLDLLSGIGFSTDSVFAFLNNAWLVYAIFAYLFSILMLVLFIYASAGKKRLDDIEEEERERREQLYEDHFSKGPKNNRMQDMINHIESENPSDWKLSIIEADIILDEILKNAGYAGGSLGERLRSISPSQLESLDDAWQAHKIRNQIAHGGADFVLTHKLAQDTIKQYRRVFYEMGIH